MYNEIGKVLSKSGAAFLYYKVWQVILQSKADIAKWETHVTKWCRLQSWAVITK